MLTKTSWSYTPFEPLKLPPGNYHIWIAAGDRLGKAFAPGKSACAWEIRDDHNYVVESPDPLVTDRSQSKQWRGYLAAPTRAVERLPNGSKATICSHHKPALQTIDALDNNYRNGWVNKSGKTLDAVDILERLRLARDGEIDSPRHVTVETREPSTALDKEIIERLKNKVKKALDGTAGKSKRG